MKNMSNIEIEQVTNQEPVKPAGKKGLLHTLRRAFLPVGLSVALGVGVGASASQNQNTAEKSEPGTVTTPADIIPPARVELIPLAKPGDDKTELIPLAKPDTTDYRPQS